MAKNWAIAVGINKYSNLTDLKYAKGDAEAVKDLLLSKAGFDQVFLFTDDSPEIAVKPSPICTQPTFGHLRRFLRAQFSRKILNSGDNLWFFFAGHGIQENNRDYLMLSDSDPGDVEHTAIAVHYITEQLRGSGADNVVLFLDACRDIGARGGGIGEEHRGVVTFYSCAPKQKAYEIEALQQGAFTYALIEALQIQGVGNCATVERLEQYLSRRVPEINRQYQQNQVRQTPYAIPEPASKLHLILLPKYATLADISTLKVEALKAEQVRDYQLARQLWIQVNIAAGGSDMDAIEAFPRITQTQRQSSTSSSKGGRGEVVGSSAQREAQQQNLVEYRLTNITTPINRRGFLKWFGLGGGGLVTVLVGGEIFNQSLLTPESKTTSKSQTPKPISLQQFKFEVVTVNSQGTNSRPDEAKLFKKAKFFKQDLGNGVNLEMVSIPGGSFKMGTEDKEIERLVKKFNWDGYRREKPQHEVTVSSFFMGKYQVTQAQWKAVAALPKVERDLKPDPSYFKGNNLPVERVSWYDAVEFCDRLSKHTKKQYRLPSEAEWEYACRAGTTTPFHFGETITDKLANYDARRAFADELKGKYRQKTTPVGKFPPNAFGLYDMHGNVWEWCEDIWHKNYKYKGVPKDGSVWIESGDSNFRVLRGGTWNYNPDYCRCAYRTKDSPVVVNHNVGLRVVCVAPAALN